MQNKVTIGSFLLRWHSRVRDGCAYLSIWMMMAMAVGISYEVIVRYFFARPTIWVADFTDYAMLYTTFFASAWLLKEDGHVRLTIVTERLSRRAQLRFEILNCAIGAVVSALLIYYGAADVWDAVKNGIMLVRPVPVPKYLILSVVPFGFLLLFVQFIGMAVKTRNDLKALSGRAAQGETP